ncbi:MmgE/PrpD family protein [Variovorax sp. SRS16]|uniref:MmgE/PrpD family protein n=1 Tax=Variovorax sp. SRS16 TaxID=282217 RepID=UPI0013177AF7|nr:MmgE/PrpD family protein [Variovorax sp. SRS16]VTU30744.1 MmgE/PrpD family protein [Variovorax sp. SRS16]
MNAGSVAQTLAERLVAEWYSLDESVIPAHVHAATTRCIKDTLGVALAARALGVGMAGVQVALQDASVPQSALWGAGLRVSMEDAALANGMLSHALDFDDTHAAAIVHSSSVLVPAALAVGEAVQASGRSILAALVVGYQVAARLGRLAPGPFQDNGFQATSVLGTFAAAIVAARLMRLSPDQALNALGIAGSMASGSMAYLSDGSDVKQMHPGWAAMSGIRAAKFARAGFRGPRAIFEHRLGIFHSFARVDITDTWRDACGAPWEVALMGPKPYPACLCVHAPVQAMLQLRSEGWVSPDRIEDIREIRCEGPQWYRELVFEPAASKIAPRTPYEARFSAPWSMARALLDGGLDVRSFSPEKLSDPVAGALAARTAFTAEELPEFPASFPARVTVTLADGARRSAYVAHNLGTPGNPMTDDDIEAKFQACMAAVLPPARADELSHCIAGLVEGNGAQQLFECLGRLDPAGMQPEISTYKETEKC